MEISLLGEGGITSLEPNDSLSLMAESELVKLSQIERELKADKEERGKSDSVHEAARLAQY